MIILGKLYAKIQSKILLPQNYSTPSQNQAMKECCVMHSLLDTVAGCNFKIHKNNAQLKHPGNSCNSERCSRRYVAVR